MNNFEFSYDEENDDLFIYLEGAKSGGAVEMGNFVFDFDKDEKLVAIQIFEASKVLSKLISKIIELTKIQEVKAEIIEFRNMRTLRINVKTDSTEANVPILLPNVRESSPALGY